VERVNLAEPLAARLGGEPVILHEIGLLGARLELGSRFAGGIRHPLQFTWEGEEITLDSRVVHCDFNRMASEATGDPIYDTGVEFGGAPDASARALRRMIAELVTRILDEQKANARGRGAASFEKTPFLDLDRIAESSLSKAPRLFVVCRLTPSGEWLRTQSYKPLQPSDGFTVVGSVSEKEIEILCRSYKGGTPEERRMIRACAELAIAEDEGSFPPKRFEK
jgi:hypothetical protein